MKWFNVDKKCLKTKDGEEIILRPLKSDDKKLFGDFLLGLSKETTDLFGPHPLTREDADKLCLQSDCSNILRLIAVNSKDEIVGYMIISYPLRESQLQRYEIYNIELVQGRDLCIAPCIADLYQSKGLGSLLMNMTLDIARDLGAKYIIPWQGTGQKNVRAVNLYKKYGFEITGEFNRYGNDNYDLTLKLKE
jgi:GNAT superfamily N-acetyltransferase